MKMESFKANFAKWPFPLPVGPQIKTFSFNCKAKFIL